MKGDELLTLLAIVRKEVGAQFSKIQIPSNGNPGLPGKEGKPGKDAEIPLELIDDLVSKKVSKIKIPSIDEGKIEQTIKNHVSLLPRARDITNDDLKIAAQNAINEAEFPDLIIEKVVTIGHMEHGRAEVKRHGRGWAITLYIPVYRGNGNQWLGSGFVAQGLAASGAAAEKQFYIQATFPVVTGPALLYQTGQFSDPTVLQPWVFR
jgi:hypothetical protein